jgi:hypothetical protein
MNNCTQKKHAVILWLQNVETGNGGHGHNSEPDALGAKNGIFF